jgi:hypothetical protein
MNSIQCVEFHTVRLPWAHTPALQRLHAFFLTTIVANKSANPLSLKSEFQSVENDSFVHSPCTVAGLLSEQWRFAENLPDLFVPTDFHVFCPS